jgi:hypothetical protein
MVHAQVVAALFNPVLTEVLATQFGGASIEIADNTLYLYKPEKHPSRALLEKMMNNGLWLADTIDRRLAN